MEPSNRGFQCQNVTNRNKINGCPKEGMLREKRDEVLYWNK